MLRDGGIRITIERAEGPLDDAPDEPEEADEDEWAYESEEPAPVVDEDGEEDPADITDDELRTRKPPVKRVPRQTSGGFTKAQAELIVREIVKEEPELTGKRLSNVLGIHVTSIHGWIREGKISLADGATGSKTGSPLKRDTVVKALTSTRDRKHHKLTDEDRSFAGIHNAIGAARDHANKGNLDMGKFWLGNIVPKFINLHKDSYKSSTKHHEGLADDVREMFRRLEPIDE